jgi:hypothetical protein
MAKEGSAEDAIRTTKRKTRRCSVSAPIGHKVS